jgi:hypothetical protein
MVTQPQPRHRRALRFHSKNGRFIAILPPETLDPHGARIGFTVVATADGVSDFKASWPCSNLGNQPIRFEYESNGDLVNVSTDRDGSDLLALSQDAQEFGENVISKRRALPWPGGKPCR